jgi:hypothetical protein
VGELWAGEIVIWVPPSTSFWTTRWELDSTVGAAGTGRAAGAGTGAAGPLTTPLIASSMVAIGDAFWTGTEARDDGRVGGLGYSVDATDGPPILRTDMIASCGPGRGGALDIELLPIYRLLPVNCPLPPLTCCSIPLRRFIDVPDIPLGD